MGAISRQRFAEAGEFTRAILLLALPLWGMAALADIAFQKMHGVSALDLRPISIAALLGLILTIPASIGVRQTFYFVRRRKKFVWSLLLVAPFAVSSLWYVSVIVLSRSVGRGGSLLTAQAPYRILCGTVIFALPFIFKTVWPEVLRRKRELAWRQRPKLGLGKGRLGSWTIDWDLLKMKEDLRGSLVEDRARVEALRATYQLHADHRLLEKIPVKEAIGLILGNLKGVFCRSDPPKIYSAIQTAATERVEPIVVVTALRFLAEYGYRTKRNLVFQIRLDELKKGLLRITTNIPSGDLWFQLPPDCAANAAKERLVEILGQYLRPGEAQFEHNQNDDGHLEFRFRLETQDDDAEFAWTTIEQHLGAELELLSDCPFSNGTSHVYRQGDFIHKVSRNGQPGAKLVSVEGESEILSVLKGTPGVPEVVNYRKWNGFGVLTTRRMDGTPIDEYLRGTKAFRRDWFRCIADLSALLERIHRQGVIHRDLVPRNVLVAPDGRVSLVDFDQALGGVPEAADADLNGRSPGILSNSSMESLISHLHLTEDYCEATSELAKAWEEAAQSDASSPGVSIAYYDFLFGFRRFPGERPWISRWNCLEEQVRAVAPGATVLELGCNLGLLSTHCALLGAQAVTGVDHFASILAPAERVARAAGVDVNFIQGDLSEEAFVSRLTRLQPEVVFAFSVLHWLKRQDCMLDLLSKVPKLFYEGHEPTGVEIVKLRELGFKTVRVLGYSERLRAVYFASRQ